MQEYQYGDICTVILPVLTYRKQKKKNVSNIMVPENAEVQIVSCSANMAIVCYNGENFPVRIDNLVFKKKVKAK